MAAQADFESWLVAREPALQRLAGLLAGDPHTAQDLVQTTLAKLYLAWDRIDHTDNVDAYARRILVNEHRSAWRRPFRRRELVTDVVPDGVVTDHDYDGSREAVWAFTVRSQTLVERLTSCVDGGVTGAPTSFQLVDIRAG